MPFHHQPLIFRALTNQPLCLTKASLSAKAPPFSLKRFEPDSPSESSDPPAMIALFLVSDQTSKFSRFIHRNVVFLSV